MGQSRGKWRPALPTPGVSASRKAARSSPDSQNEAAIARPRSSYSSVLARRSARRRRVAQPQRWCRRGDCARPLAARNPPRAARRSSPKAFATSAAIGRRSDLGRRRGPMTARARWPRLVLGWRPDIVSSTPEVVRARLEIVNRGGRTATDVAVSVERDDSTIFEASGFSIGPGQTWYHDVELPRPDPVAQALKQDPENERLWQRSLRACTTDGRARLLPRRGRKPISTTRCRDPVGRSAAAKRKRQAGGYPPRARLRSESRPAAGPTPVPESDLIFGRGGSHSAAASISVGVAPGVRTGRSVGVYTRPRE
jgi:hypothetical protein